MSSALPSARIPGTLAAMRARLLPGFGRSGVPEEERSGAGWAPLIPAGIWLVFLAEPLAAAWAARSSARGVAGIVVTVAFAVAYLWHFHESRGYIFGGSTLTEAHWTPARRTFRYAVVLALTIADTLLVGQAGTSTWVFLAVCGLWTMPMRWAFPVGFALAGTYEGVVRLVDGWSRHAGVSMSILLSMFAMGGGMLAIRRSRDLSAVRQENARLAVEEERGRLARDIHDILGHSLTVITVKAELAGRLLDVDIERARGEIASLETLAREALADVRGAVVGVREISLAGELARAKAALAAAGIDSTIPNAMDDVDPALKELFAWTVRESVTNVVRHSDARHCTITLSPNQIRVTDDGRGVNREDGGAVSGVVGGGNGLRGLRERARLAGATVTTRHLEPSGFEVVVAGR